MKDELEINVPINEYAEEEKEVQRKELTHSTDATSSLIPQRNRVSLQNLVPQSSVIRRVVLNTSRIESMWMSKDQRLSWFRPCYYNKSVIIYADSFGAYIYNKKELFPNNSYFLSLSGCDLVECCLLLSHGSLVAQQSTNDKDCLALEKGGRNFYNKMNASDFRIETFCSTCQSNCISSFRGKIVIASSLNGILKADRQAFQSQDIHKNINKTYEIAKRASPLASVYFVKPQKPTSPLFTDSVKQQKTFRLAIEALKKFKCIGLDELDAVTNSSHSKDGIHLSPHGTNKYWLKIKNDIESLE